MERKIKLIWDFKGPEAVKFAEHHAIHLKEYIQIEKQNIAIVNSQQLSNSHAIAYMVVNDAQMRQLRDILKPHRGELYEE